MHSNWSYCLQEVFNSGKLAEKSYHQHFKNFAEKLEDVTLEDVSSTQQYEETPMISERVKKQQVPKEDDRSAIPIFKSTTST